MNPTEPLFSPLALAAVAFLLFPAAAALLLLKDWIAAKARQRRAMRRSQAHRGLSYAERRRRLSALHLDRERARAIESLGTDWVLHPEYRGRGK